MARLARRHFKPAVPAKQLNNWSVRRLLANGKDSQQSGGRDTRTTMTMETANTHWHMVENQDYQGKKNTNNLVAFLAGSSHFCAAMNTFSLSTAGHGTPVAALTLALLLVLGGRAHSSTLIQITPDDPSTAGAGFVVLSSGWNVLNPLYSGVTGLADYGVANLLDSNGNPTGIALAADDTNRFNAYNSGGSLVASSGFPADVKRESFFGNDVSFNGFVRPTATWVFGGFDPNDDLTFTFFASRMGVTDNREGLFEVVGATTLTTTLNASNNDTNTASMTVKANASGDVVLNMTKGPNNDNTSGFFYLNAMTIEVIPEPSSTLMVLVAGLGLCVVRRRR